MTRATLEVRHGQVDKAMADVDVILKPDPDDIAMRQDARVCLCALG